jgi:hypothetical protein
LLAERGLLRRRVRQLEEHVAARSEDARTDGERGLHRSKFRQVATKRSLDPNTGTGILIPLVDVYRNGK